MTINEEKNPIDEIIASGESQALEFKRSDILSDPVKLAREMVAFANSIGGRILIGICDDGTVEGMKAKKEHELFIMNIARDRCDPPLVPSFSIINKKEGDIYELTVTRFRTFPHAARTESGKVYYIRVGTTVREATSIELALLFESSKEEITKKPDLDLFLIDREGNQTRSIIGNPVFKKIKKVKAQTPSTPFLASFESIKYLTGLEYTNPFSVREPPPELVPISIGLSNNGQAPAREITIFLDFPEECELINELEVIGGMRVHMRDFKPTHGGLYVDPANKSEAVAWMDGLGNDLVMSNFEKIYLISLEREGVHD